MDLLFLDLDAANSFWCSLSMSRSLIGNLPHCNYKKINTAFSYSNFPIYNHFVWLAIINVQLTKIEVQQLAIADLQHIANTYVQLAITNIQLANTYAQLAITNIQLAITYVQLAITNVQLAITYVQLATTVQLAITKVQQLAITNL